MQEYIFFNRLGKTLRQIFSSLAEYNSHHHKSYKIEIPYFGKVEIETLEFLFIFFWRIGGYPNSKELYICLDKMNLGYYLQVKNNHLIQFKEVKNVSSWDIRFNIEKLQKLERLYHSMPLFLFFCILRGDTNNESDLYFHNIFSKLSCSSSTFATLVRWFFPLSGMCLILEYQNYAIPLLCYGGSKPRIKILDKKELNNTSLAEFTKYIRHSSNVSIAVGISLTELIQQYESIDIIFSYGKMWVISLPIEIDDFIFSFPEWVQFLPQKTLYKKCNLDKIHLIQLFKIYIQNFHNYIQNNSLYFHLQDLHNDIFLEWNKRGISEVSCVENIPKELLFKFDMETLTTMMAWLNDTSLRLIVRFLEGIMPAEISENIKRDEILACLTLKNEEQSTFLLYLSGGEQHLPIKRWQGDFYLKLIQLDNHNIILQEKILDVPCLITEQNDQLLLDLPLHDSQETLTFLKNKSQRFYLGMTQWVSDTSILSEIAPGLRGILTYGTIEQSQQIIIHEQSYTIIDGKILWQKIWGNILKQKAFLHHSLSLWLGSSKNGMCYYTYPQVNTYSWWKQFILSHGQGGIQFLNNDFVSYNYTQMNLLEWTFPNVLTNIDSGKCFPPKMKLFIEEVWAVPYDYYDHYLIRIRAISYKKNAVVFLEFPFVNDNIKQYAPFPVHIHKEKKSLLFFYNSELLLHLKNVSLNVKNNNKNFQFLLLLKKIKKMLHSKK